MPGFSTKSIRNESHCYSTEDTKGEVSTYDIRSIRVPGTRYACSLSPGENAQQRCTSTYNAFTAGYRITFLIFRKLNTLQHRKAAGTVHRVHIPIPGTRSSFTYLLHLELPTRVSSAVRFAAELLSHNELLLYEYSNRMALDSEASKRLPGRRDKSSYAL